MGRVPSGLQLQSLYRKEEGRERRRERRKKGEGEEERGRRERGEEREGKGRGREGGGDTTTYIILGHPYLGIEPLLVFVPKWRVTHQ